MKDTIGYLRVSIRKQGRSGLGLAAQPHEIEAFCVARRGRGQARAPGYSDRRRRRRAAAAPVACGSLERDARLALARRHDRGGHQLFGFP